MKIKWSLFFPILMICLSVLACNLPSTQQVNAAATAISLTLTSQPAQAPASQQTTAFTSVAASPSAPTQTPTSTQVPASPTPSGTYFVTSTGANCRSGPGQAYPVLTTIPTGYYITIVGHNNDSSWWFVQVKPSLDCWISGSVGYTTGNPTGVPLVAAPPLPTQPVPPTLNDPVAVNDPLSYPGSCNSNELLVAIRVADNNGPGLDSVWLKYRYASNGGYVGNWHTVSPNDSASGGQTGFDYPIGPEAQSELGTSDGKVEYKFYAKDKEGNTATYPSSGLLQLSLHYCP